MKILVCHNYYQSPGGEDAVFQSEQKVLRDYGEEVITYERHNSEISSLFLIEKLKYLSRFGSSQKTYREVRSLIRKFKPDVAHFHNIFFMITPEAYLACRDENVPVVQSQHNFRLLCANALFYRDNKVCEDCLEKTYREGIKHRCYKGSLALSNLVARMIDEHWRKRTWTNLIDLYIVAAEFTRQKYIQGGIPEEKITVKPHFFPNDPGQSERDGGYALYVGRLSKEKGVDVLIKAWRSLGDFPLKIMGDGKLMGELKDLASDLSNIQFLGHVSDEEYDRYMREAKFLIIPSVCYENFPRIVAEAYAYGIPLIASRLGSLKELVIDGKSGVTFEPGNPDDLAQKVKWMLDHEPERRHMQEGARSEYEQKYTAEQNYKSLISIYEKVMTSMKAYSK